jgi:hypothetical protein
MIEANNQNLKALAKRVKDIEMILILLLVIELFRIFLLIFSLNT